jgi:hypothetical protein
MDEKQNAPNHICYLKPEFMENERRKMQIMSSLDACKGMIALFCDPQSVIDEPKLPILMEVLGLVFEKSRFEKITVQEAYSQIYKEHHKKLWDQIRDEIQRHAGIEKDDQRTVSVNFTTGEVVDGDLTKEGNKDG